MIIIAYILVLLASLVMVYFGHAQGTAQFYTSVFSAAIIWYCVYLDYKKRREKKAEKNKEKSSASAKKNSKQAASASKGISNIAHRSTKDKSLNNK